MHVWQYIGIFLATIALGVLVTGCFRQSSQANPTVRDALRESVAYCEAYGDILPAFAVQLRRAYEKRDWNTAATLALKAIRSLREQGIQIPDRIVRIEEILTPLLNSHE